MSAEENNGGVQDQQQQQKSPPYSETGPPVLQGECVEDDVELPEELGRDAVRELHARIEREWGPLPRTACQTAAGRAVWGHVVGDPLAAVLAGEAYLRSFHDKMRKDRAKNAREISGVMLAVRTLWFDTKVEAAVRELQGAAGGRVPTQLVLLGAGMDARAYRLNCLHDTTVFEVDFPEVLQVKAAILQEVLVQNNHHYQKAPTTLKAKSLVRVAADIRDPDWTDHLHRSGYRSDCSTVWVLEGLLYYLTHQDAARVLGDIAAGCVRAPTVLLADFINESSVSLCKATFHFYCDWPEHMLAPLGFTKIGVSQIGDQDANFGLVEDPLCLFNKQRKVPRSVHTNPEDGTPCKRLYLVAASGSPAAGDRDAGDAAL